MSDVRKMVKGLPVQPGTIRRRISGTFFPDGTVEISSDEEELQVLPKRKVTVQQKRKAEEEPMSKPAKRNDQAKDDKDQETIEKDENSININVDPFSQMYPRKLDRLIIKFDQTFPVYKVFREGTKYQYTTVQYKLFDPTYILEPFTDAIRQPNGQMYEYKVYFSTSMTLLQYIEERKQHEDALIESVQGKPKTFLAFYMKWKRHQAEFPVMQKYLEQLYGKYPPWRTFEEIVIRRAVNKEYGFLNI